MDRQTRNINATDPVPTLTGALSGLKIAEINDLPAFQKAIENGKQTGFGYYFPHILSFNKPGQSAALLIEDAGSICVFRWKQKSGQERLDLLLAPSPMNVDVLKRCLDRANTFNADKGAKILKIDEGDIDQVSALPEIQLRKRKSQYLYAPATYTNLSGNRLRTIRRNVNKIQSLENLETHSYSPRYKEACLSLLQQWRAHHRSTHGTMGGVGKSRQLLDLADLLGNSYLRGEIIQLDGVVVGFTLGGELRPGVAIFSEAKSDVGINGLSIYQRYSFMLSMQDYQLINDGPDVGREGLAQLKNSLRPVGMHNEYSARQM